jgi:hypothetical protein
MLNERLYQPEYDSKIEIQINIKICSKRHLLESLAVRCGGKLRGGNEE